ncbi:MAG: hypothetical protein WCG91_01955 [Candidatus Shapirobacteria bacterium]
MTKKILIILVLFSSLFFSRPNLIFAEDTVDSLSAKIAEYSTKLTELSKSKNTLANQIKIIDSNVELTQLKITQTETSIKTLDEEINNLSGKIGQLDIYLNQLSSAYIVQVSQNYKLQKRIPSFALFFTSRFNNFLNEYKYLATVQKNNQENLVTIETTRTTYDIQKTEKSKKQAEMEALKKTLASQQISLDKQKKSKNILLEATKNDERNYQQLLSQARAQLNGLRNFSSSAGGGSCLSASPGRGSDGNFYSQRDPSWCHQVIGISNDSQDTIGSIGCYISSLSMVFKKAGSGMNPSSYASNPDNFGSIPSSYMLVRNPPSIPSGYSFRQTSYSTNTVDNELKSGRYVIAELSAFAGTHFVVIISGSGGSYKIHDPWYGPDMSLNDHYGTSLIRSLRLITK